MTSWPTISEYKAALQHPQRVFADSWLQHSLPTLDRNRLPFGISGGFGVVFPMTRGGEKKALKCFTEGDRRLLQPRYEAIQLCLDAGGWPAYMVHFRYLTDAMLVQGQHHPVLLMDWIDGPRLNAWLRAQIDARTASSIRAMAERWSGLVLDLGERGIAHGDLQHGNVLVVGDQPVLVDYDGMFIPGNLDMPPEGGYPGYQHPGRATQKPSAAIDHFAAWVILLSLRASAADLAFFDADEEQLDDTLLFREEDLEDPTQSWVWRQLLASSDAEVRAWSQSLLACFDQPFEQIPPFVPRSPTELRLALQRQDYLDTLQQLATADNEDADRAFAAAWEEAVGWLAELDEAEPLAERYRQCAARLGVLDQLRAWMANPVSVNEDMADLLDHLPAGYVFDGRADFEALCDDAGRIKDTLTVVLGGAAFAAMPVDYVCIRQFPYWFEPHRQAIERLAQAQLHQVELSSSWTKENGFHLTWHWHRWANSRYKCYYAVTADRWLETPDAGNPNRGEGCLAIDMEAYQRHSRRGGGVPIAAPDAEEAFVTVWPVIALEWKDVIGDPLHIGPIPVRHSRNWLAKLVWRQ
jgi:predicted Ser/Thr protein kinase